MKMNLMMRVFALPLVLFLALFVSGCENPVGSGGEHPEGLVVVDAQGSVVASYLSPTSSRTGQITVAAGSEQTYRVFLLTRGGSRIELDGLEYSINQVTVTTGLFATANITGVDQLRVRGTAAGLTTLILPVQHGTHTEFLAEIALRVQ
ncbi:hypothetical protein BH23GEM6_BH23GEM6_12880 [soil metagenome]